MPEGDFDAASPPSATIQEQPPKTAGLVLEVDKRAFSNAIHAGAEPLTKGKETLAYLWSPTIETAGHPLVESIDTDVVVVNLPKEFNDPPITGWSGKPSDIAYQAECLIRLTNSIGEDDIIPLTDFLRQQGYESASQKHINGNTTLALSKDGRSFDFDPGTLSPSKTKGARLKKGMRMLAELGRRTVGPEKTIRAFDALQKILGEKEPKPARPTYISTLPKPLEIFDNDMQDTVEGLAACTQAVVNGLTTVKGTPPLNKTAFLEPPAPQVPPQSLAKAA